MKKEKITSSTLFQDKYYFDFNSAEIKTQSIPNRIKGRARIYLANLALDFPPPGKIETDIIRDKHHDVSVLNLLTFVHFNDHQKPTSPVLSLSHISTIYCLLLKEEYVSVSFRFSILFWNSSMYVKKQSNKIPWTFLLVSYFYVRPLIFQRQATEP